VNATFAAYLGAFGALIRNGFKLMTASGAKRPFDVSQELTVEKSGLFVLLFVVGYPHDACRSVWFLRRHLLDARGVRQSSFIARLRQSFAAPTPTR
jgi:hypothetical protein